MAKRLWQAFTVLGLIFTIQLTVNAQIIQVNKHTLTVGAETGKVTAYEGAYHNVEAGSTLQLQYGLSKRLALTLTSGYYNFLPKTFVGGYNDLVRFQTNSYGIVPVKAGIKYFIIANIYLAAEAGVAQQVSKNTGVTISGFAYGYQYNDNQYGYTKLILSPGLGLFKLGHIIL